jgi:dihydroflavonol-4-reductase
MRAMLTGATGFVGGNLLDLLLERGWSVRCLVRDGGRARKILPAAQVELLEGDIRDPQAVESCARGCQVVFHTAADYRLWVPDPSNMFAINVEGTKNVLRAAARAGVERVVHTSSVGALGIPRDGSPGTEETPVRLEDLVGPYKRSKYLAEQEALKAAREGLDVVVVNPSTPVGPKDRKPTPTGRTILDFLRGRMPAYVDTGLNLVHVRDVAEGHLLALERGRSGQKYILGNQNMTLKEIFQMLAEISGLPAPAIRLPRWPILIMAYAECSISRWITHREPRIPLDGVRMAAKKMFFDPSKALGELGLPQSPVRQALAEAVSWFRGQGYVESGGGEPR